jgi:hypothetical protein
MFYKKCKDFMAKNLDIHNYNMQRKLIYMYNINMQLFLKRNETYWNQFVS